MKKFLLTLLVFYCTEACPAKEAKNWPQWRGPHGNGVAESGDYPTVFSAEENIAWRVELPGRGSSTPIVWRDQIFVTSPIDDKDGIVSYDFAGSELWRKSFGKQRKGKHAHASGCNPSPVTDGTHVVAYYKSGKVACVDLGGNIKWEKNLQELYGEDTLWWDLGTSPVLSAGNAIIAVMQDGDSFLVAIDLESGQIAWKQDRKYQCKQESDQSYSTPQVLDVDGREIVLTWGADHLTGHAGATGDLVWECGGFNQEDQAMWRVIASAVADDEVAIVPYGRGQFLAAIDLRDAQGDITTTHRLWETSDLGTDVPTPLLQGEHVLVLSGRKKNRGKVYYLNKYSGGVLWEEKLPKANAEYYASPVLADDICYFAREDGVIMTCKATSDGMELIAENDMGETLIATPIPIRGQLLVRGEKHLFMVGK